ncbi:MULTISPECIES: glutamine--fructose-6-phosphate transaminase (isomerizing) [Sphingobacterium]|uniref:Glutamine--fructose-6-phosphate aminotransferase [isomerizing] n=1 Tax=Sphingobacterium cellulitidis TaxID=1768011 RepID=A0A8H9FXY1_9SPHI|nr:MULTISPECIES: glutamine--fructose-6-phosphate transaminase (isomerizing) [Sphingobacterium]MBA8987214.1 glucosamine--fructose-6-phosphate aminotransferase (isomerizing) [Sphingobacterium soli]OYD40837.1 glutamine--fructose-6-phosphate transaminase (isomerizing) [Sphingobacterium cellulitidis]WFB64577.1 glutamine--fructose-6-phosphate transaminase (isomerizing) [Sphingobacterium sp. WM]GGE17294.1 glutamine--fructose-6-phosphate aminotransferase [isomerizing] [Sphingobacterium soli]
MCGIVGYTGTRQAYPIVIDGLKKLEYRGYDSAGVALQQGDSLMVYKKAGKVAALEEFVGDQSTAGTTGIGHTRWATHGEPSDRNAHPHYSKSGKLAMIHNGIIENYAQLKNELTKAGYEFKSDTDSEVLLNFIEDIQAKNECGLEEAIRIALKRVTGAYVILIIAADQPDTIIAARKGSPLVIGIGKNEHFLGSDASPMLAYTKEVVYINDYELAIVKPDELILKNLGNEVITPFVQKLDIELAAIEKGGYDHFMLKEIFEQPTTIADSLRGRLILNEHRIILSGVDAIQDKLANARRIIIVACGTSWHAGLVAEYVIEELCRVNVEVEYASEFRYRNPVIGSDDVIIAISQSGETADTLVALERAKAQGATIFGIVNVVGSSIARISHAGCYTHAGPEIGVASTKAYTAQLAVLMLFALKLAKAKGTISDERFDELCKELNDIPEKVQWVLDNEVDNIKAIAYKYKDARDVLYLGRGYNFPTALEGALKLKEISYIHAEGYPAAEMKHGPIALVDEELPVVFIASKDAYHEKIVSNIQEIKARKGMVISVMTEGDEITPSISNDVMVVPEADEVIAPLLTVVPLQLLSYYIGVYRGLDVDKPRNLAKSVTVE